MFRFKPHTMNFKNIYAILTPYIIKCSFNSVPANFCHLLKTFANSLDPDQGRRNMWHELNPNPKCLSL